jgi:hypothetical protein
MSFIVVNFELFPAVLCCIVLALSTACKSENSREVDLEFSSPSSPNPPPSGFIMSSMRNTALLRTLGKSLSSSLSTTSTRPILRQSTCIRPLSSFQSPARHSPPFRPTRFYSTTPLEDIKVYTFKDVFFLSSPNFP